jgi:magnesium-transporting ATPase (P-type)
LILVANATVGVLQESGAEAAVEALKEYESPTAAVFRDGHLVNVPAAQLVVGDIIEVEGTIPPPPPTTTTIIKSLQ